MKTVFLIEIKKGQLKVLESNLSKLLRKPNLNFKFLVYFLICEIRLIVFFFFFCSGSSENHISDLQKDIKVYKLDLFK